MMTEYVVLGALLVVMGAVQMWLRYGSWAKEQQAADKALVERRAEAADNADADQSEGSTDAEGRAGKTGPVMMDRGSKLWNKWTAILGPLGIALGLFLVLWGIFQG